MNLLRDVITYVRRLIKSPSNADISDALIIDYINRFYINDVQARIQLFDYKTKYSFQTQPGVDQYNMPLYDPQIQPGDQLISLYPVYQGFVGPAYINGIQVSLQTQKDLFFNAWPNVTQNMTVVGIGDGSAGPYTLRFPIGPNNSTPLNPPYQYILRGHVDISGIIATGGNQDPIFGTDLNMDIPSTSIYPSVYITSLDANQNNVIVQDSGQFLRDTITGANMPNYGLLMSPGTAPFGYNSLPNGGALTTPYATNQNTINYLTGVITNIYFPVAIPQGVDISAQCNYFNCGLPRSILFYNNTLTLRSPPDTQYLVELDAYLSPSAFLSSLAAIPFAYMSEYLSLGAARKILSDTGDAEQLAFYEPRFLEQQSLVHLRSQRQWTSTRTHTLYSMGISAGQGGFTSGGSIL